MAVGAVSSSQTQSSSTPATAPAVLRSGETLSTTQAALSDPKAKTYYHMVSGAKFTMPNGLDVVFMGGRVTTADPEIIAELDKIADRATSMIASDRARLEQATAAAKAAAADSETS